MGGWLSRWRITAREYLKSVCRRSTLTVSESATCTNACGCYTATSSVCRFPAVRARARSSASKFQSWFRRCEGRRIEPATSTIRRAHSIRSRTSFTPVIWWLRLLPVGAALGCVLTVFVSVLDHLLIDQQVGCSEAGQFNAIPVIPFHSSAQGLAVLQHDGHGRMPLHLLYPVKVLRVRLFWRSGFFVRLRTGRMRPRRGRFFNF